MAELFTESPGIFIEGLNNKRTFDEDVEPAAVQVVQAEGTLLVAEENGAQPR